MLKLACDDKSRVNFFSLAVDNRIIHWRYQADKWVPKVYDFGRILKEYPRVSSDAKVARSAGDYRVTDFLVYGIRDELYVSDSLGRIVAVKLASGEVTETHCFYQIEISHICFSPNQSYLCIFYSSGCCQVVSSQSFQVEINLIDHQYDPNASNKPFGRVKMREDLRRMKEDLEFKEQTKRPIPKHSEDLAKKNFDVAFMALASTDFNAAKLFYLEKGISSLQLKDSLTMSTLEPIEDFDFHKSLNYVMITTRDGSIQLFSLKTREFVFRYDLEMRIRGSCADPSGLYMIAGGISPKLVRSQLSVNCTLRSRSERDDRRDRHWTDLQVWLVAFRRGLLRVDRRRDQRQHPGRH